MKCAVFPGSFDPITLGHLDILERSIPLFDEIIIGVGSNSEKKYMFPLSKRMAFIEETFSEYKSISVAKYQGLTIEFCKKVQANFIIRGLRNPAYADLALAVLTASSIVAASLTSNGSPGAEKSSAKSASITPSHTNIE